MGRFIISIVVIALVGGSVFMFGRNAISTIKRLEFERDREQNENQFLRHGDYIRDLADPKLYNNEVKNLVGWWFTNLDKMYQERERPLDPDAYWKDKEARKAQGKLTEDENNSWDSNKKAFEYSKQIYEMFRRGSYSPLLFAHSNGVRMDIYNIVPVQESGQKLLKADFILWGYHGKAMGGGEAAFEYRRVVDDDTKKKELEEARKTKPDLVGLDYTWRSTGKALPNYLVPDPWRKVDLNPPAFAAGYYLFSGMHPQANKVDFHLVLKFTAVTGGSIESRFEFKDVDIDPTWKFGWDNVQTQVTTTSVPEDELNKKEGDKK
ncbi:MAG: hypothetical protein GMKNLPBB_03022 [Myxococcota bacterium]|nr:hypothetical protein [Myxococcota bacterium]